MRLGTWPARETRDQLGGLVLTQQTADRGLRHKRRGGFAKRAALAELPALIDAFQGRDQTGMNDARGTQDGDAK